MASNQTWGTWEGLLLACAVHRHGSHSWDSVAAQLHNCTSSLSLATPLACKHKFQELQLRFSKCHSDADSAVPLPWLEELRNLRVLELRRDVQRYDHSIVSLQLKVRSLTEEREHSIKNATEILDLEKKVQCGGRERKTSGERQPITGEESDKENRSINESNSTDPKADGGGKRPEKVKVESVRSEAETERGGGEDKQHSCDGSCDSVAESAEKLERVESGESNSKGEGSAGDIQSWAGRSKGTMDQSGCAKRVSLQSQPFIDILQKLRSHNHKQLCVFKDRRLANTQEMPDYQKVIRQHLDLQTLGSRVEEGFYSDCTTKFFRDLLLLLNNALVYFRPKSEEYQTALELRKLVSQDQVAFQVPSSRSELLPPKTEAEAFPINTKLSLPSTACRKRSSLAVKATRTSAPSSHNKRSPQLPAGLVLDEIEKPVVDLKHQDESESREVEVIRDEKSTSPAAPRITKTKKDTTKSRSCVNPIPVPKNNENNPDHNMVTNSKKRTAANFLTRIKRGSPPDKVSVKEETLLHGCDQINNIPQN